jgi:tetratricopeptide (TPR) repeat protein
VISLLLTAPAGMPQLALFVEAEAETAFQGGLQLPEKSADARRLFRRSAEAYEKIRRRGADNADLYRNQGNAYLLAGDLPRAILAYRRGLRLAPNDRDLRRNLAHAREQVAHPPGSVGRPPVDHWPPWLPRPVPGWLLAGVAVAYSLGCLALTRWLMWRRGRLLAAALVAFLAALLLGGWLAVERWRERRDTLQPLVVIADDGVLLRRGNGPSYPPRCEVPLSRGVEGRRLFERGSWLKIELAGGEVGWVPSGIALADEP